MHVLGSVCRWVPREKRSLANHAWHAPATVLSVVGPETPAACRVSRKRPQQCLVLALLKHLTFRLKAVRQFERHGNRQSVKKRLQHLYKLRMGGACA